jgi:hypothetical protein
LKISDRRKIKSGNFISALNYLPGKKRRPSRRDGQRHNVGRKSASKSAGIFGNCPILSRQPPIFAHGENAVFVRVSKKPLLSQRPRFLSP